jgi:hypothetical protein
MPKISTITAAKFREESVAAQLGALAQLAVDALFESPSMGVRRTKKQAQSYAESLLLAALASAGAVSDRRAKKGTPKSPVRRPSRPGE